MQCYPDRAVEREVMALLVWCQNKPMGCSWQGKLQELEVRMMEEEEDRFWWIVQGAELLESFMFT